jgi:hypothetical protein
MIGDDRKQQMTGQVGWCLGPEYRSPSGTQWFDIETAQSRDLAFQR